MNAQSLLPGKDQHAPRTITVSTPPRPATEKQVALIAKLRQEKDDTGMGPTPPDLDVTTASTAIEWLLKRPARPRPEVVRLAEGNYELDGTVYRVTSSNETGNTYVLILNLEPEAVVKGAKMIWLHDPSQMTYRRLCELNPPVISAERAGQIGHLFERCIFCNRHLSRDESVNGGFGQKCAANNGLEWGVC